ncbi:MAG: VWA domain-containing protein [Clostridiales bacterium]|nr:VWA domain-containing protein [Clostridiales bacterium]
MKTTNRTELVFILDRSGSMCGLESDTIGGFNSMLEKQKQEPGAANVTTVLFDDRYELLHDRIDIQGVAPITNREYYVRGCTALLDAIGRTIQKVVLTQRHTLPEQQADKVLFVIITDGMENASREYSYDRVRKMVEQEQTEYGWEFLFLGANIDAISTARQFGIGADRAVNFHADGAGVRLNYEAVSCAASCLREGAPLQASWKADIDRDFQSRKSRKSRR